MNHPNPGSDANRRALLNFVAGMLQAGLAHAVLSPGSRSGPIALALDWARQKGLKVHVCLDERSAGFFALGIAKATGSPTLVACTSGTAAANLHPAVLEAHHSATPLVVITADRPWELHGIGAGQTVDQSHLYQNAVRLFLELDPPTPGDRDSAWAELALQAWVASMGPPPGPVHLNWRLREPLVWAPRASGDDPAVEQAPRPVLPRWTLAEETISELANAIRSAKKGLLVAGPAARLSLETAQAFFDATHWPLLADPLSGLRWLPFAISRYDAFLRVDKLAQAMAPELVVHVGGTLTSKVTTTWLGRFWSISATSGAELSDPERCAQWLGFADANDLLTRLAESLSSSGTDDRWLEDWLRLDRAADEAICAAMSSMEAAEPTAVREAVACLGAGSNLVVASSMPVRYLDWFCAPKQGVEVFANRGANGIDGFASFALGVASGRPGQSLAIAGDLSFLHDLGGLAWLARDSATRPNLVLLVLNNDGGGIFEFLAHHDLPRPAKDLFVTPHGISPTKLARALGIPARRVHQASGASSAIKEALSSGGLWLVEFEADREASLAAAAEAWRAVRSAIS